jgi:predicted nucleotidyltransferase
MDPKIRLTEKEFHGIQKAFTEFLGEKTGEIYLFGSRTDASKKGGDIDLLVIIDKKWLKWIISEKIFLITKIKNKIGDQRIDITCATQEQMTTDEFLKTIVDEVVLLKEISTGN